MSSLAEINNTLNQMERSTADAYASQSKVGTTELGQDAFLRLLIEQMKNQDPLNPMDNSQMLAQNAQFTQITELQKLNSTMSTMNSMNQAVSLIGKEVTLVDPNDTTKTISGEVVEVRSNGSESYIVLDSNTERAYSLLLVQSVKEATPVIDAN